jgi:thiosulfate/3-mercaptopyruvate sulfurtransferase
LVFVICSGGDLIVKEFSRRAALAPILGLVPLAVFSALRSNALAYSVVPGSDDSPSSDPWAASQTVTPAALVAELIAKEQAGKPTVVCVGFRALYQGAHIPGASFHGAASTSNGIADLKDWARLGPRAANVVLYCGCCPLERCPNLKPAFLTLRDAGFTNLRVLLLPHDFNTDWIEKGYAVEKKK